MERRVEMLKPESISDLISTVRSVWDSLSYEASE
jgi:hypothetical protein